MNSRVTTRRPRSARRRGSRLARKLTLAVLGLAIVAACAPQTSHWTEAETSRVNRVDYIQFGHSVQFTRTNAELAADERARLQQFLVERGIGQGDEITLAASGTPRDGTAQTLAARRETAVLAFLRSNGLKPSLAPRGAFGESWDGSVAIAVGRYLVTPPDCPDWRKLIGTDPGNHAHSNLGCANTANLGLMIANPADLVRGRTLGPADGTAMARGVEKYHKGPEAKPAAQSGFTINIGGGQGGQGGGNPTQ